METPNYSWGIGNLERRTHEKVFGKVLGQKSPSLRSSRKKAFGETFGRHAEMNLLSTDPSDALGRKKKVGNITVK